MKKLCYFAFAGLLALGAAACNDDDDKGTDVPKSLTATPDALTFAAVTDAPLTIEVKAQNVTWEATTEAGWLTLSPASGNADGTISVTASDNETTELQHATIVIRAEGVEDVKVAVTQEAGEPVVSEPTIIYDRSSRSRMNFQGSVKSASVFGLFLNNTWESIDNLQFDATGMLTSFTRNINGETVTYSLAYDAANRLTECAWSDSDGAKSIELAYGDHGKYIYTDNLFNDLSMTIGVTNHALWLPRCVKDLERITCKAPYYRDPSVIDTYLYRVEVTGDTGKICLQLNDEPEEENAELGFTGPFTSRYVSTGWFGSTTEYTLNPENGNLLQYTSDDGYSTIVVTYNDDRINSLAEVQGDISTKLTYNDYLDAISVTDPSDNSTVAMSYEYDADGNWTKMTVTGGDATTRNLTYYE